MKSKSVKIIQLLLDEGLISERYAETVADICIRQAKDQLEKELGHKVNLQILESTIERLVK